MIAIELLGSANLEPFPKYILGLGIYAVMTALFLFTRINNKVWAIFEYPVALSIIAFIQFGLAPLYIFFARPDEFPPLVTEQSLINAFPLCMMGMTAFWIGASVVRRRNYSPPDFSQKSGERDDQARVMGWAIAIFVCGIAAQLVLNLDYYNPSVDVAQFFYFAAQLGTLSLVIVTIEMNARANKGWFKVLFWIILPVQCIVGFFSGMKGIVLVNVVIVAIITWIIRQNIPRRWLLLGALGLIILYPVINSMRTNDARYNVRATDLDSALTTGREAFEHAAEGSSWLDSGMKDAVSRLDMLSSVAQIQTFGPAIEFLDCGERVWMIPFYPFVPRFLWKNKPSLDQGWKFSLLLGGSSYTAIALTYVGDSYRMGGTLGTIIAMFLWGCLAEGIVQFLYADFGRIRLFMYIGLTFITTSSPIEGLVFNIWCGTIRQFVWIGVLAIVIYGLRKKSIASTRVQSSMTPATH